MRSLPRADRRRSEPSRSALRGFERERQPRPALPQHAAQGRLGGRPVPRLRRPDHGTRPRSGRRRTVSRVARAGFRRPALPRGAGRIRPDGRSARLRGNRGADVRLGRSRALRPDLRSGPPRSNAARRDRSGDRDGAASAGRDRSRPPVARVRLGPFRAPRDRTPRSARGSAPFARIAAVDRSDGRSRRGDSGTPSARLRTTTRAADCTPSNGRS